MPWLLSPTMVMRLVDVHVLVICGVGIFIGLIYVNKVGVGAAAVSCNSVSKSTGMNGIVNGCISCTSVTVCVVGIVVGHSCRCGVGVAAVVGNVNSTHGATTAQGLEVVVRMVMTVCCRVAGRYYATVTAKSLVAVGNCSTVPEHSQVAAGHY